MDFDHIHKVIWQTASGGLSMNQKAKGNNHIVQARRINSSNNTM